MVLDANSNIFVAGHSGMVGSAVVRSLQSAGFTNLLTARSSELDLRRQADVEAFFLEHKPDVVILAAAKVGGIGANQAYPADFIYDNLSIVTNVVSASHTHGCRKLINLGSSCIYPREAPQPIPEKALLAGPLESTNRAYAIAKIAGIELCDAYRAQYGADFISLMPCNLYGPGDNFNFESSHVIPAMIRKFHTAVESGSQRVLLWGSGKPRREFMYVDDMADSVLFCLKSVSRPGPINVGTGKDLPICELAAEIAQITGFEGTVDYDLSKPDGTPRKVLDVSWLSQEGWEASTSLSDGLRRTYAWFLSNQQSARGLAQAG